MVIHHCISHSLDTKCYIQTDRQTDRQTDEVHSFNPLHQCGGGLKLGKTPKNKSKTKTETDKPLFGVSVSKRTNEHRIVEVA